MSKIRKTKPDKSNKYDEGEPVSEWKSRISRMKKYQTDNSKNWGRNKKLLFGASADDDDSSGDNEFAFGWGLVKSLETAIYVQNPEMAAEPYSGKLMETGHLLTNIANYDIDQMNLKAIGNLGLIDNFVNGFFACIETIETDKESVTDGDEEKVVARDQRFSANRIAPKDLLLPAHWKGLIDLSAAQYLAIATYPTIASLESNKDKVYTELPKDIRNYPEATPDKRSKTRDEAMSGQTASFKEGEKDPAYKTICVWECHDKVKQEIVYVTDHKMQEIGRMDWPVKFKVGARSLFPVTLMAFHPMADAWPKPELDLIAPQLMSLNRLDREIYSSVFNHWNKHVTIAGALSADEAAKLTDQSAMHSLLTVDKDVLLDVANSLQAHEMPNLREMVVPIENPEPKKDSLAIRDMCMKEITDIIGYGPPDRGGLPKTRTAREAVSVKEKLEARLAKRSDAVGDFYRDFGQKHLMFLQQRMEIDRYVRVFDSAKNLVEWQSYARADIEEGLFNFIVYAGTSAPRSTEARKNSEIQLFQTLMPLVQGGMIPPEPVILRLAEAFQWKGVDALLRNYKPAMKQLAKVLASMQSGQVPPNVLPEAAAAAVQAALTPEELSMLANEMQGQSQGGKAPPAKMQQSRGDSAAVKTGAGVQ